MRYYLSRINPVDGFRVSGAGDTRWLEFDNLGLEAGLATDCEYTYQWYRFDNDVDGRSVLTAEATTSEPAIPIPPGSVPFPMVRMASRCDGHTSWASAVEVFLRGGAEPTVVGVDRADPATP